MNIIEQFNQFLKIKNQNKVSKSASKRLEFLENEIIKNSLVTIKPYQFCTTRLAKKYGVHHSTVGKWLKSLVSCNILRLTNGKWHKGKFSKRYKLTFFGIDKVNLFNGYAEKFAKGLRKKVDRHKKLKNFDALTYTSSEVTFLATGWLGCPQQYMEMVKSKVPKYVLRAPREWNAKQAKHVDFFRAYNQVVKSNKGYKKLKWSEWEANFDEYEIGKYGLEGRDPLDAKRVCLPLLKEIASVTKKKSDRYRRLKLAKKKIQKAYKYLVSAVELGNGVYPAYGTLKEMF
jgi:hypothetical protein